MARLDEGPSFCWSCNRRLMIATVGSNKGHYAWSVIRDRGGVEHRVHKQCVAREVGNLFVRDEFEDADAPRRKMQVFR